MPTLALAVAGNTDGVDAPKQKPVKSTLLVNEGSSFGESSEMSPHRRLSLLTAATALAQMAPSLASVSNPERKLVRIEPADTQTNEQDCKNQKRIFPEVLMNVLSYEPAKDMIKWLPDGKGFIIAEPFDLSSEILPKFFKHSQFESFVRKLNRWGFRRVARGECAGAFYHEHFVRHRPDLCRKMKNRKSVAFRGGNAGSSGATVAAAARDRAAAVSAGQLAAAHAADLRRPGVGVELDDPLLSVRRTQLAAAMMKFPMRSATKLRMVGIPSPGMTGDGATKVFPMEDAMAGFSLLRSGGVGLSQLRHPFPSSRGVSTSSASSKLVLNKPDVKAAFLRHQQLLIKTQESRAILQEAGLMAKPQAC